MRPESTLIDWATVEQPLSRTLVTVLAALVIFGCSYRSPHGPDVDISAPSKDLRVPDSPSKPEVPAGNVDSQLDNLDAGNQAEAIGETVSGVADWLLDNNPDETVCEPQCDGKSCGLGGCGESCGECPDGFVCEESGGCVPCEPSCLCKDCGADGCGGSCGDCDDGNPCSGGLCMNGKCQHVAAISTGCCSQSQDCEDGDPCTDHLCYEFQCITSQVDFLCCQEDEECNSEDPCNPLLCVNNECILDKLNDQNCCKKHSDCVDDDPETLDYCEEDQCTHVLPPTDCDCGPSGPDCPATPGVCTVPTCVDNCKCLGQWIDGCCLSDNDCNDANPGTDDVCIDNSCAYIPKATQCSTDWDCTDNIWCNIDVCFHDNCYRIPDPAQPDCCEFDADCEDCDPCTTDHCFKGTCQHDGEGCGNP